MNFYIHPLSAHKQGKCGSMLAAVLLYYVWIDPEGPEHAFFLSDISSLPPSPDPQLRSSEIS